MCLAKSHRMGQQQILHPPFYHDYVSLHFYHPNCLGCLGLAPALALAQAVQPPACDRLPGAWRACLGGVDRQDCCPRGPSVDVLKPPCVLATVPPSSRTRLLKALCTHVCCGVPVFASVDTPPYGCLLMVWSQTTGCLLVVWSQSLWSAWRLGYMQGGWK